MKQVRIKCWFYDSEKTIAYYMMMGEQKIKVRKIIDPATVMQDIVTGEQYDIFGKEEEVDSFIKDLCSNDRDIEVIERAE